MPSKNDLIVDWLEQMDESVQKFMDSKVYKKEKRLEFLSKQYKLVDITVKIMNGKARLVGVPQRR